MVPYAPRPRTLAALLAALALCAGCAGQRSPRNDGQAARDLATDLPLARDGAAPATDARPDAIGPARDGSAPTRDTAAPRDTSAPRADAASPPKPTCSDNKKNGDETDVDCGGATCRACAAGKACRARRDCQHQICISSRCVTDPLARAFSGQAVFVRDQTGLGRAMTMHFISTEVVGSTIYAHYIDNVRIGGVWRSRVGLATSTDGVAFAKRAVALDIGGSWETTYAARALSHQMGELASDGGWAADTTRHNAGYMVYGPYRTFNGTAAQIVSFELLVDSLAGNIAAARIEVHDFTASRVVAQRTLYRDSFAKTWTYQVFNLQFTPAAGHQYEFRVYWHDTTYTRVRQVALATGTLPLWDNRLASFPGTLRLFGTWYLVYEGAGLDSRWPGDVGLVTSSDPAAFRRSRAGPFLRHATSGWERVNIGTPSLYSEAGRIYLFYHGFDGTDVQLGLATFSPGGAPVKHSGNPVIRTSASGWDSGTVGKRSRLFKENGYYYMAYEGSTEQPFDKARWSSGLARSPDLYRWTKSPVNPVIPQTSGGFGNDGPELVRLGGRYYLYVRSGAATDRYRLQSR